MDKSLIDKVIKYNDELVESKKTHEKLMEMLTLSEEFEGYDKQNPIVIRVDGYGDLVPKISETDWNVLINKYLIYFQNNICRCADNLKEL
jgi:hypothetical protein